MVGKMSIRKSFILSVALVLLTVLSGCGDKIDYSLPDNPEVFMAETYINPFDQDDGYMSIEYKGRTYVPFGVLDGNLGGSDIEECLGFIARVGDSGTDSRVFTLTADPKHNFLVEMTPDGFMDPPMFYRAIDTYLKDIVIPDYIYDQDYDVWKEYDYEPVEEDAEEPEEVPEDIEDDAADDVSDTGDTDRFDAINEEVRSQIEVFIEHKDEWIVPYEETEDDSGREVRPTYTMCDLDCNGRCELIAIEKSYYQGVAEINIYEISEDGKSLTVAKWDFDGLATTYPEINLDAKPWVYFNTETKTYHYLLQSRLEDERIGYCMCDMAYSDGQVSVYGYESVEIDYANERYIFLTPEGEIDAEEFYTMQKKYPYDYKTYYLKFGLFDEADGDKNAVNWDDEFTSQALFDSFRVFSGQMEYKEFLEVYIPFLATYY